MRGGRTRRAPARKKAVFTAADLIRQRETGYIDGLTIGRREGRELGVMEAWSAVAGLLPPKPAPAPQPAPAAKPVTAPPTPPAKKPVDWRDAA